MEVYFGDYLRDFRLRYGTNHKPIPVQAVADKICISQPMLSNYEHNKYPTPLDIVTSIKKAYNDIKIVCDYRAVANRVIDESIFSV